MIGACRAESNRGGGGSGFAAGFLIGGTIFGALGYIFAPQVSSRQVHLPLECSSTAEIFESEASLHMTAWWSIIAFDGLAGEARLELQAGRSTWLLLGGTSCWLGLPRLEGP